jgi:hypothetical protein
MMDASTAPNQRLVDVIKEEEPVKLDWDGAPA